VNNIQIDRYSSKSDDGVSVEYIDTLAYLKGWKVVFIKPGSWVSYNQVDFGKSKFKSMAINAMAPNGGSFEIRVDSLNGKVLAQGNLTKSTNLNISNFNLKQVEPGIHNLYFVAKGSGKIEVDYIRFE